MMKQSNCRIPVIRLVALVMMLHLLSVALTARGQEPDQPGNQETKQAEDEPKKIPTIQEKSSEWQKFEGFQSFFWDEKGGKVWLEISAWNREFLFVHSLSTGLGSNPIGLDRGQLGQEHVCRFERVGPKVLLIAKNLKYRALSPDENERRAVNESFAPSVLWGGQIGAETDGIVLVDVTGLMLQDMHDVAATLKRSEQGDYKIDPERSAVFLERSKAFPKNTELESMLTFAGDQPGPLVRDVATAPRSITLRQHLSFVELPDDNYHPRVHDPRCPSIFVSFADYSSPIAEPLQKRWIMRHRLQKKDSSAALSEPVEPIIYYVDSGAPQPIRDALIEGASWWNEAFESAGFKNAFQVRVLPDDADPMDVRYNVIQWVHRSTRGWSYGGSVVDPRTGEIIKGHVSLGSLRVRQDQMILNSLTPPAGKRACNCCGVAGIIEDTTLAGLSRENDSTAVALARIRQLSAHEVGHTLGFAHNFAASTYADRASVMDYPAPRIKIAEGNRLDLSDAYGVGIGVWDKWSVQFAYAQFSSETNEQEELERLVQQAIAANYLYISDADSRPVGAAHPLSNLWDNGTNPVDELNHLMVVRRLALKQLGEQHLRDGETVASLGDLLVPVYLLHRYQVDATAKLIGGAYYSYAVKGDGQVAIRPVPAGEQNAALRALLVTLQPSELAIPDELLKRISPQPYSSYRDIELFSGQTSPIFDSLGAARVAADITIGNLLQVERVSRLAMQSDNETGLSGMFDVLVATAWGSRETDNRLIKISHVVRQSLTDHLMKLADHPAASTAARAAAEAGLYRVQRQIDGAIASEHVEESNFAALMQSEIKRFRDRPHSTATPPAKHPAPPGSPIGGK